MTVASEVKQTLARIKGIQGTLRIYASQSQSNEVKKAFNDAVNTTNGIINDLENRIKTLEYEEPQYKGN